MKKQWLFLCVTALMVLVGMTACQPKEIELPFETMERADQAGTGEYYEDKEPKLVVVTDATELDTLGNTVSLEAQAQLQDLDFKRFFVIVVFQGWRPELPSPQSGVEVQKINKKGRTVTIYVNFYEPIEGYMRMDVEISPYHLIKLKGENMRGEFEFVLNVGGTDIVKQTHFIP